MLVLTPVLLAFCTTLGSTGMRLPDLDVPTDRAIFVLRLGRVLAGFCVGGALAGAGCVMQALLRNPLAEPYLLGVSSGAGLGAALAIVGGLAAHGVLLLPLAAFAGATATLALVYLLALSGGRVSIYGLILSGVIVSSVSSSLLMVVVSLAPAEGVHGILWWMLGNLELPSRALLAVSAAILAAGCLALWAGAPAWNALSLGTDIAHGVGVRVRLAVVAGLGLASLVTATAVALAGLIGFVGLIVPHVVRRLTGPDHRRLLPAAVLTGGVFLALCDAVARTALAPRELPVGVITALLGGPFFLFILRAKRRGEWVA